MNLINKILYRVVVYVTVILFLLISPAFVFSQVRLEKENDKPRMCEEKAKDETRWMTKNLYLNADQYDRVESLNLYYSCLLESINQLSDKGLVSKRKLELIKNKDAEFKAILSEEQYQQYKDHKEKKVEQKKSPFSGNM